MGSGRRRHQVPVRRFKCQEPNVLYGICMVVPLKLLENSLNKKVSLLLKDNRILEGKLVGYDDFMNMVLEETEETVEGGTTKRLNTVILRGNNVVSITPL